MSFPSVRGLFGSAGNWRACRNRVSLSKELQKVRSCLCDNTLPLHLGKSECVVFGSRHKLRDLTSFSVEYNGTVVQEKCSVSSHGCELDQCMSGETMAPSAIGRICSKTKCLARMSIFLDKETMRTLATSLVHCHFDYTCMAWYSGIIKKNNKK